MFFLRLLAFPRVATWSHFGSPLCEEYRRCGGLPAFPTQVTQGKDAHDALPTSTAETTASEMTI